MEKFVIEGGRKLKGEVTVSGNKNEALPVISASILSDGIVTLSNVPEIEDVLVMIDILRAMGAEITRIEPHSYRIDPSTIKNPVLNKDLCRKIRASILLAGPLLSRFGCVELPPPGGDVIGRRRLDTHFASFEDMGALLKIDENYNLMAKKITGSKIFLDEQSVTATENIIMLAVKAEGTTIIENAACEPHVQGLCKMLNCMSANIEGIGTNILKIHGVSKLSGITHTIGPDYLESGSFIGLSALTGDGVLIKNAGVEHLRKVKLVFEKLGITMEFRNNDCFVPSDQELKVKTDLHGQIPVIDDAPWPQFPTDMMSVAIIVATQSKGTVLFFEKMYDGRMFFIDNLVAMGAQIILCDPHRVVVIGPSQLYSASIESPDIRAGMALLIAALCGNGVSNIYNVRQIDRGYENIDEKLRKLGAGIERVRS